MSAVELTCRDMVEIITDYLEGAMSATEAARFEEHLEDCDGCVNYLDQMRQTIVMTGAVGEDSLPPEAFDRLIAAFRGWRDGG